MLEQTKEKLQQLSHKLSIEQDEFQVWKESKVTKRMLADFTLDYMDAAESIGGITIDDIAIRSVTFAAKRQLLEAIFDWLPEELKQED